MLLVLAVVSVYFSTIVLAAPSPNLPCKPMQEYLPPHVQSTYNMSRHNGTWFEVAFRDLYPWGPLCRCQQSIKYVNEERGYIDDYFVFTCYPLKLNYISPQRENVTNGATGERHPNGIYDMTVRRSDFKAITKFEWNTEVIGFKDDGQEQYQWVIEFQCGTRPNIPKAACLGKLDKNGSCSFTGVQMFVRDRNNVEQGYREMVAYLQSLGPAATQSANAAWVMTDMSGGTFPRWFKNVTWSDSCPMPCSSGVYNETTKMWGCPKEHKGVQIGHVLPLKGKI